MLNPGDENLSIAEKNGKLKESNESKDKQIEVIGERS
jgi:hypothetical protein